MHRASLDDSIARSHRPRLSRVQVQLDGPFQDDDGVQSHSAMHWCCRIGCHGDDHSQSSRLRKLSRRHPGGSVDLILLNVFLGGEIGRERGGGVEYVESRYFGVYPGLHGERMMRGRCWGEDGFAFGIVSGDVVGHAFRGRWCSAGDDNVSFN